ncbi:putative polysaccharide biosynthesis protein [Lactobacillus selangorensis]|nr:polysaccharide biosynthesis protein [Lactobacillus selangorensis]
MLKGSAWMTAGSIFSRVLGAIYIIPWMAWMGAYALQANALFAKGYQIYAIFLTISTAGVPGAISKQVAHYNAINEYATGRKLFRHGMYLMIAMGVVSAAIFYFAAPLLSAGDARMIPVMHSLSWALLLIPMMSIMRGFFQGYSKMAPSAISQFVEQLARVIYMLVTAFLIMKVIHGSYVSAVSQSTFAAFIGAIFGLAVMMLYYLSQRKKLNLLSAGSYNRVDTSTNELLIEIIRQALPFIIMDSGINLFYLVDQYTFNPMLGHFMHIGRDQLDSYYALFAANANKLIMITISLATAMAVTAIPLLSAAHARHDVKKMSEQISNAIQMFCIIMIPSAFGMSAVAKPLYILFYGTQEYTSLGILLLEFSSYVSILLGLFTILAAILQGLYQNRTAIADLLIGLVVKFALQYPMIGIFHVFGPMISTAIGFGIVSWLMLRQLNDKYHIRVRQTNHRLIGILVFTILMVLGVKGTLWVLDLFMNPAFRAIDIIELVIAIIVGVAIYGYLILKTRLADLILGARVGGLRRRLHIK